MENNKQSGSTDKNDSHVFNQKKEDETPVWLQTLNSNLKCPRILNTNKSVADIYNKYKYLTINVNREQADLNLSKYDNIVRGNEALKASPTELPINSASNVETSEVNDAFPNFDAESDKCNINFEKASLSRSLITDSADQELKTSPTSSITSHKPLEWDSWADVGYQAAGQLNKEKTSCGFNLFGRNLIDEFGCTKLRLDLEESVDKKIKKRLDKTVDDISPLKEQEASTTCAKSLIDHPLNKGLIDESKIYNQTNFLSRVGYDSIDDKCTPLRASLESSGKSSIYPGELIVKGSNSYKQKSLTNPPNPSSKYSSSSMQQPIIQSCRSTNQPELNENSVLKRNSSMNELVIPSSTHHQLMKRSQSELNLQDSFEGNDLLSNKSQSIPRNFVSTSSITTIINKLGVCDKNTQTNLVVDHRLRSALVSKAIQVCLDPETIIQTKLKERKKKLERLEKIKKVQSPKSNDDLADEETNSFVSLKSDNDSNSSRSVYKLDDAQSSQNSTETKVEKRRREGKFLADGEEGKFSAGKKGNKFSSHKGEGKSPVSSEKNQGHLEKERSEGKNRNDDEVDDGRASNSFEYLPGYMYKNYTQSESICNTCSSNTEPQSYSTLPNTSSSLDEKLWGDSDNLLHDLERSLSILKRLINTNKYNKQMKRRLIHHVIKRLITARYVDDRIEHKLEDNVPWNPDNARNKIYYTEIIKTLAKKKKNYQECCKQLVDDDSKMSTKQTFCQKRKHNNCSNKFDNDDRELADLIQFLSSENSSDIFDDQNTDKTDGMQDGRKARLGLRSDDRYRHSDRHYKYDMSNNTLLDLDVKSESSECFLPQSHSTRCNDNIDKASKASSPAKSKTRASSKNSSSPIFGSGRHVGSENLSNKSVATATIASTSATTPSDTTTTQCTATTTTSSQNTSKYHSQTPCASPDKNIDWKLPITVSEIRFKQQRLDPITGSTSRLVDYVENEKRNQLKWINNEIMHLAKLKKLLEEPAKHGAKEDKKISGKSREYFSAHKIIMTDGHSTFRKSIESGGNLVSQSRRHCYTQTVPSEDEFLRKDQRSKKLISQQRMVNCTSGRNKCVGNERPVVEHSVDDQMPVVKQYVDDQGPVVSRCIDDQRPIITQSVINSKKETKNRLNANKCRSKLASRCHQGLKQQVCDGKCSCQMHRTSDADESRVENGDVGKTCCRKTRQENDDDDDNSTNKKLGSSRKECKKNIPNNVSQNSDTASTENTKCVSVQTYQKPIAYEIAFNKSNKGYLKSIRHKKSASIVRTNHQQSNSSLLSSLSNGSYQQLEDYLRKNKPEFVDSVERRKKDISEITKMRRLKQKKIHKLLEVAVPCEPKIINSAQVRQKNKEQLKISIWLKCLRLNEIKCKLERQKKVQQLQRNLIMAKIFGKKLQEKVLKGCINLSPSVSVMSDFKL